MDNLLLFKLGGNIIGIELLTKTEILERGEKANRKLNITGENIESSNKRIEGWRKGRKGCKGKSKNDRGERNQLEEETERGDGKKKFVKNPSWIEGKKKEKLNKNIGETNKINRV